MTLLCRLLRRFRRPRPSAADWAATARLRADELAQVRADLAHARAEADDAERRASEALALLEAERAEWRAERGKLVRRLTAHEIAEAEARS